MSFPGEKEPHGGAAERQSLSAEESLAKAKQAVEEANAAHLAFFQRVLGGDELSDDQKTLFEQLKQDISIDRFDAVVYQDPVTGKGHTFREYFVIREERGEKVYEPAFNEAIEVIEKRMAAETQLVEAQKQVEAEQQEAKRAQEKVQIEAGHVMSFPGGWRQIQDEANRYQAEADAHVTALRERMDRPMPTLADLLKASPKEQQEGPLPGSGQEVGRWDKKDLPPFQGGVQEWRVDDPAAVVGPEVQTMIMPEPPRPPSLGDRFKSLAKKLFG